MSRTSLLFQRWEITDSAGLRARLLLLFLITTVVLFSLLSAYWLLNIEPRLRTDAETSAAAFAQSQANNLADVLERLPSHGAHQLLLSTVEEILILRDASTNEPFILGLEVRVDYDSVAAAPGSLDLSRGSTSCDQCFVSKLPLFSPKKGEVLGVVTFYSSNAFFARLRADVRMKLLIGSLAALMVLAMAWWALAGLFERLKANEEAARSAAQAKSDFLATMSHEIRTPMNGILGMVHLLQRTELEAAQRDYVKTIAESGETLLTLLNDILDISRIEAGRLRLEVRPFELAPLVDSVAHLLQPRAEEEGLSIQVSIAPGVPPWLQADENRLRQVLLNLVGNAVKFTASGSVTVAVERRDGAMHSWLEFSVTDTGPGIPKVMQQQLFEPFTQADSGTARRYGGSGLGLAICKRLVEAMDGLIGVDSAPGQGSTFYFRLPMRPAESPSEEHGEPQLRSAQAGAEIRPLKVLVADDSPINRRVVTELLRQSGHRCVEAVNGREAVEAVEREAFDVVLMDLHMPELDGLAATREIRALDTQERAQVPILAVSADIMPTEQEACREAGMNGFIAKPFSPPKLEQEMARLARPLQP